VRRAALLLVALSIAATATSAAAMADCRFHRGEHVVLYGTTDDPAVLAWDSRARLREYHGASFDEARAMLPHALLVAPGTHAVVAACSPNYVESPIFSSPDDAVGVVLSAGPQRGVTRWVLSSDLRPATH
jgi:hypothetical protein